MLAQIPPSGAALCTAQRTIPSLSTTYDERLAHPLTSSKTA